MIQADIYARRTNGMGAGKILATYHNLPWTDPVAELIGAVKTHNRIRIYCPNLKSTHLYRFFLKDKIVLSAHWEIGPGNNYLACFSLDEFLQYLEDEVKKGRVETTWHAAVHLHYLRDTSEVTSVKVRSKKPLIDFMG
jgi:hypothetical protein